jgi:alanyl-tRNA synthetase
LKVSSSELREKFLSFFRDRGHTVCPSAPLAASGDPTLLFTAAGMVQFKEYYSSEGPLAFTRAASVQKCLRLSDLENVGRTLRHHTFFEMLGNFSFGDYFKEETIDWAWEFVTEVLRLSPGRLWVSVYEEDDEARRIWEDRIGIPHSRVVSLGKKDNFWGPVGRTGVCGPCSEIYIDLEPGPDDISRGAQMFAGYSETGIDPGTMASGPVIPGIGCGKHECKPGCECERFLEFWNLVFPQFYKEEDGSLRVLKKKGIDTGMGLERLAMIVEGKKSVFETDLLKPLIEKMEELLDRELRSGSEDIVSANVVADHIRALAFAFSEGMMPSNEERGYVLRRLLRRASRRMRTLGAHRPLLYKLVGVVTDTMKDAYPELSAKREHVARITKAEEERFEKTLELGIARFEELAAKLEASGQQRLSGQHVFTLYDTYGFPPDLTEEMARERGFNIDVSGFEEEMEKQRRAAQGKSRFVKEDKKRLDARGWETLTEGGHSKFVGYKRLQEKVHIRKFRRLVEGDAVPQDAARKGAAGREAVEQGGPGQGTPGHDAAGRQAVELILDKTPFYAESGGQIGDSGRLISQNSTIEVTGAVLSGKAIIHRGKLIRGEIEPGPYDAIVDAGTRLPVARNHTATHLLHCALRAVLGDHVRQAGSLVAADRLRFDYMHFQAPSASELEEVEDTVNEMILEDLPVCADVCAYAEAIKGGAMALFGEKYGERVRQISVGTKSKELCGGTHVERTGQVGHFLIVSDGAIGSGIRRIEAVTGAEARARISGRGKTLQGIRELVGGGPEELLSRISDLVKAREALDKMSHQDEKARVAAEAVRILTSVEEASGIKVVAARVDITGQEMLREVGDLLRQKLSNGAGIIGAVVQGKALLLAFVGDLLLSENKVVAGDVAREAAKVVGGGGGGKPHMATAGGHDVGALDKALARAREFILERVR